MATMTSTVSMEKIGEMFEDIIQRIKEGEERSPTLLRDVRAVSDTIYDSQSVDDPEFIDEEAAYMLSMLDMAEEYAISGPRDTIIRIDKYADYKDESLRGIPQTDLVTALVSPISVMLTVYPHDIIIETKTGYNLYNTRSETTRPLHNPVLSNILDSDCGRKVGKSFSSDRSVSIVTIPFVPIKASE